MNTLWLHLKAPFAAFRWMQAGVYRATSPVIPPSTAWGLVLNLAGIDVRTTKDSGASRGVRTDAPALALAIGSITEPETSTLYQQLHSYPVGSSGKELAKRSHGGKYWIAPVRRELLVGFEGVVGIRAEDALLRRVRAGLAGELKEPRYGLPFAGDNNLLFDDIRAADAPPEANWFMPADAATAPTGKTCRLTVSIDRQDASRTVTRLFAQTGRLALPPSSAWVETPVRAA